MCPALVPVKNQDRHTERRREEAKLLAAERAAGAVHEQAERGRVDHCITPTCNYCSSELLLVLKFGAMPIPATFSAS